MVKIVLAFLMFATMTLVGTNIAGITDLSWWWVLALIWVPPALVFTVITLFGLIVTFLVIVLEIFDRVLLNNPKEESPPPPQEPAKPQGLSLDG